MAINKVVYGGRTLIDLSGDTITPDKVLAKYKAHGADGEVIEGTCTYDADTSDATATEDEILEDTVAYNKGNRIVGKMKNNHGASGTISKKDDEYAIPQGYHDGSGKVGINATEKAKLIPSNIREGVTILDVTGTMSGSESEKKQSKEATPTVSGFTVLPDSGYTCLTEVVVKAIPYVETPNSAGGTTVSIA